MSMHDPARDPARVVQSLHYQDLHDECITTCARLLCAPQTPSMTALLHFYSAISHELASESQPSLDERLARLQRAAEHYGHARHILTLIVAEQDSARRHAHQPFLLPAAADPALQLLQQLKKFEAHLLQDIRDTLVVRGKLYDHHVWSGAPIGMLDRQKARWSFQSVHQMLQTSSSSGGSSSSRRSSKSIYPLHTSPDPRTDSSERTILERIIEGRRRRWHRTRFDPRPTRLLCSRALAEVEVFERQRALV